jgi:hypothetical protein
MRAKTDIEQFDQVESRELDVAARAMDEASKTP